MPTAQRPARWIVCEATGRWAIGLRREPGCSGLRFHEVRSLADAWALLAQYPSSFVVVELTRVNAAALLERMICLEQDFPGARMAVVADRSLAPCEWLMREAGAVWFASSPRELGPVVALARRHLQLVPAARRDLLEDLWNSLPWGPDV